MDINLFNEHKLIECEIKCRNDTEIKKSGSGAPPAAMRFLEVI